MYFVKDGGAPHQETTLEGCMPNLDPSDKLPDDEIRIRMQALLSHMTLSGIQSEKFLRRIIGYQRMEG